MVLNKLIPPLYVLENTIKAFFKISRSCRVTSSSRLRRRSSSRLRRLVAASRKGFVFMSSQFLAPLVNGAVGNAQFASHLCDRLSAALGEPYGFSLELSCVGALYSLHYSPPSFWSSIPQIFLYSTKPGEVQARLPWKEDPSEEENDLRLVISADGAMVPLTGGEWAEVRTLALGEAPACPVEKDSFPQVHVRTLSYFSRLRDAATFTDLAEVETRRRHLVQAKEACAVMVGADWLQAFVEIHRADAVRILDFPHAAEHLAKLLEALRKSGLTLPAKLLERCLHLLKHRGPSTLARMADRLTKAEIAQEDVREHLGYVRKRLSLMQYPTFQRAGWPIGSGMVESANKLVVEARFKGTGMRWERKNANPMLTLRNGVCNERWQETWHSASHQRRDLLTHRRHQRAAQRQEALKQDRVSPPPPILPLAPLLPPDPPAMIPGTSRPSEHHPWKRGPACTPKLFAKR
jgi:hypothetical protein